MMVTARVGSAYCGWLAQRLFQPGKFQTHGGEQGGGRLASQCPARTGLQLADELSECLMNAAQLVL